MTAATAGAVLRSRASRDLRPSEVMYGTTGTYSSKKTKYSYDLYHSRKAYTYLRSLKN